MQAADREGRAATAAAAVEEREPMPQYEYICDEDGEVLTLLRPMRSADDPVEDPAGLLRVRSAASTASSE